MLLNPICWMQHAAFTRPLSRVIIGVIAASPGPTATPMTGLTWKLCLRSAAVDSGGKPKVTHTLALSPNHTSDQVWENIVPKFAPRAASLELRAASDRDVSVVLQSVQDNKPDEYLTPDWSTAKVHLVVHGGLGVKNFLPQQQGAAANQRAVKRGRDQASASGRASTLGSNPQLGTGASQKMRDVSKLLLKRSTREQDECTYVPYTQQPSWATSVVIKFTTIADGALTEVETTAVLKK